MNDGYGVDWWLVITLDREYMLGDIDRSTLAAQERIRDEVDSVDENLVRSRIILVVTVVVASVLLMLLALMLVIRIVAPLVQLQEEMARVAVMNLSQVDETRAISNIEEVGHMQTSFLQMLRNLKEYRNYMPASVLVEDMSRTETETEDDSSTWTKDANINARAVRATAAPLSSVTWWHSTSSLPYRSLNKRRWHFLW